MQLTTLRILDASLNRASEGLRVVEDYARFALDDLLLAKTAKAIRHELIALTIDHLPAQDRCAARDTPGDVGTAISTPHETSRRDAWQVCVASLKRIEQAMRSLEEYGKLVATPFAAACEQLRYRMYTLEKALHATRFSRDALAGRRLYVLIDGQQSNERFAAVAQELLEAGVDVLQLRDKLLADRELLDRAKIMVAATRAAGALAIINDRPDLAALANADGVHLGQDDLSVTDAKAIAGPRALVGVSTHTIEQARQAVLDGADYLGAGPTFSSQTKSFATLAGLKYLSQAAAETSLPTFAIGGINAQNLPQVLATGVERVAVGSAVTGGSNPPAEVQRLKELLTAYAPSAAGG